MLPSVKSSASRRRTSPKATKVKLLALMDRSTELPAETVKSSPIAVTPRTSPSASRVTSPSVPALTVPVSTMSPLLLTRTISLASSSVVEVAEITPMSSSAVTVIPPLAVDTSVRVTTPRPRSTTSPAEVERAVTSAPSASSIRPLGSNVLPAGELPPMLFWATSVIEVAVISTRESSAES